jgi:hypothetical protein
MSTVFLHITLGRDTVWLGRRNLLYFSGTDSLETCGTSVPHGVTRPGVSSVCVASRVVFELQPRWRTVPAVAPRCEGNRMDAASVNSKRRNDWLF